jgi:hypothetical protein
MMSCKEVWQNAVNCTSVQNGNRKLMFEESKTLHSTGVGYKFLLGYQRAHFETAVRPKVP